VDTTYLQAALKELGLENYWQPVQPAGDIKLAMAAN
jgi:hypothetical protein